MNSQYKNMEDTQDTSNTSASNIYTSSDLSAHNTSLDCWSTISSKVYDLTSYVYKHPGGPEQILAICGKDGTSLFSGQHGGNMKIEKMLSNFYKGDLVN